MIQSKSFLVAVTVVLAMLAAFAVHFGGSSSTGNTSQAQQAPISRDYLSRELRDRVQQLKRDVESQPTNAENAAQRALLLYDWANAYSVEGGIIPVNLTQLVSTLAGFRRTAPASFIALDRYVRELQLREEQPAAIGNLTTDSDAPYSPGSYATISQTYHFGDMPMVPGGGFFVARHFMSNMGQYQTDDPAGENYVSIQSSNPDARFVPDSRTMQGMHGGFRGAAAGLFFRLEEGTLTKRDTVTIVYGDKRGGSPGLLMQTFSNDAFPLPLYVDLKGNKELLTLPIQTYKVGGGPVSGVKGFAPSVVKTGESFSVSIRSEDRYRNRADGEMPEYQVTINGQPYTTIAAGSDAIASLEGISFDEPGVYRIGIRSSDGAISGNANPIWVQDDPRLRVYWGDTHGHCGFAEGQGTPKAFWEFGRDDARLDFLTHSEHDLWLDDSEWNTLIDNVNEFNDDGKFVAILGYEWSVSTAYGGHHNVFFRTATDRKRVPNQTAPVLSQLYRRLGNENDMDDVLIIPHAHQTGEYRMNDPNMETLVEIMSMHGNFEWFGKMYLQHGHEVGFVAASDDHLSHPGYSTPLPSGLAQPGGLAAVLATENTRDAIFDSLKDLAAYATTGHRIILDVDLNGARMGTRTVYNPKRTIKGRVIGTAPIDEIALFKNGEIISTEQLMAAEDGETCEVRFASESDPGYRDIPRGWRPWRGTLSVSGAKLVSVDAPSMSNLLDEYMRQDEANPNRVEFSLLTRGSIKNLVLKLAEVTDDAKVQIQLDRAAEGPSPPPLFRRPASIPRADVALKIGDSSGENATWSRDVEGLRESISLRQIKANGPLDHEFEFIDSDSPQQGDYYFIRVKQIDGGMAWSSPIWVGGISVRYDL